MLENLLEMWNKHENKINNSFSLIASENILSPLASLACAGDFNNRYFFDDPTLWGENAFRGGKVIEAIQSQILIPLLKEFTASNYVNVKPLSGLNCMNIVFASYCKSNDVIFCLPEELGGHSSTAKVAKTYNLKVEHIPYINQYEIDLDQFSLMLQRKSPALIYIDQCCVLFPINISEIFDCKKMNAPNAHLHVDTSHLNGLVFARLLSNPLRENADSFGGSTHKTFPGPVKAFFATENEMLFNNFNHYANHLISHSHTASMVALAVSLLEFKLLGGQDYIKQTLINAKTFAKTLAENNINVQGAERGFTSTHQVWIDTLPFNEANEVSHLLYNAGLIVSCFPKLPGINHSAIRVGLNQPTRYGLKEPECKMLATAISDIIINKRSNYAKKIVHDLRENFNKIRYCYEIDIPLWYRNKDLCQFNLNYQTATLM